MHVSTLPLFPLESSNHTPDTPHITEDKITQPLTSILEMVTPQPANDLQPIKEKQSIKKSLDELFPEQQYDEKNIQKAKQILGPLADEFTPEQLKVEMTKIQYLCETWLDDFEKKIFKGLTLKELLHEKGGL